MKQVEKTSRRNFLKTSALVGTAAAVGVSMTPNVHAEGKEEVKIGMIGSGSRCSGAAVNSLHTDKSVKLVAMCDIFDRRLEGALEGLTAQFPDQVAVDADHRFIGFDGYQKVIDSCDVVLIACASKFHPKYAEAAIKAGKSVFVEKPHAIDPVGVKRLENACALAKEKGVSIMSGLQSRWDYGWQDMMKRIHDGEIGDIVAMQSMFLRGPYQLVGRNPKFSETEYQFSNWYHFCWLSGDDVTQSLVHNVDRMSWAMQGELPTWAFATAGRSGSFGEIYGDMFDHSCVVYEYKSGARLYALCRTTNGCYNNSSDIIMGSKATCYVGSKTFVDRSGKVLYKYEGKQNNPYDTEQAELIKAVRTGEPVNCGHYMCNATMMGIMGQIASFQGNSVTWEEAYNSDLQFGPSPDDASFETDPPTEMDETGNYPVSIPGQTRYI